MLLKIAFRNILRNRRRSILTGSMMGAGFIFVSFSLAFVEGSYGDIIRLFTGQHTGHVQITNQSYAENPSLYKTVPQSLELIERLRKDPRVQALAPRIFGGALAFSKNKSFGAEIVGIDPLLEESSTHYTRRLISGQAFLANTTGEVIVGKTVAKVLSLKIGSELALISQAADGSIANELFTVRAVIGSDSESRDDFRVYLPLKVAEEFFALYGQVHEIAIHLHDIAKAKGYSEELDLAPALIARPWQVVEQEFFNTMETDKEGNNVTLFILMMMVGIGVLNTVLMSTLERTREFGVLKALGTLPSHLFSLIVLEAFLLSLIGTLVGLGIAWGLNYYFSVYGISFDEPVSIGGMVISEFKSTVSFDSFLYPALIVSFTALLASLYPAFKAAKISVADALREF